MWNEIEIKNADHFSASQPPSTFLTVSLLLNLRRTRCEERNYKSSNNKSINLPSQIINASLNKNSLQVTAKNGCSNEYCKSNKKELTRTFAYVWIHTL